MSKIKDTKETWNGKTYSEVEEFVKEELDSKAERAENATAGNIAVLDEHGNPADSGHSTSEYLTEHQHLKTVNGQSLVGNGDIVIPRGNDAVNPFKGWFDTIADLPESGTDGDYAYISGSPAVIHKWQTDRWINTGKTVDTSNVQTFGSSESVGNVKIDSTNLKNPATPDDTNSPVIAKASDVMTLRCKLDGITAEEVRVEDAAEWHPDSSSAGYYTSSGWSISNTFKSTRIDVGGYKAARFIGYYSANASAGYLYQDVDGNIIEGSFHRYNEIGETAGKIEIESRIPEGAKYLVCMLKSGSFSESEFYCYLRKGETVSEMVSAAENRMEDKVRDTERNLFEDVEMTDLTTERRHLVLSNGTYLWSYANTSGNTHYEIVIRKGDRYLILRDGDVEATNNNSTCYTIAKRPPADSVAASNPQIEYAEGWQVIKVETGDTAEVFIEKDYAEDYLLMVNGGEGQRTRVFKRETAFERFGESVETISSKTESMEKMIVETLLTPVDTTASAMRSYANQLESSGYFGQWGSTSTYKHFEIDLSGVKYVKIKVHADAQSKCRYFFTKSSGATAGWNIDYYGEELVVTYIDKGEEAVIPVPTGAAYMMVYAGSQTGGYHVVEYIGVIRTVTEAADKIPRKSLIDKLRAENTNLIVGNTTGNDETHISIFRKRIDQLSELKWTPKETLSYGASGNGTEYSAGVEYMGIPYSGNANRSVGGGISIETFMTAVENPYSLFYTEKLHDPSSSCWITISGVKIRREPTNENCELYYGAYCNSFVHFMSGIGLPMYANGKVQEGSLFFSKRIPQHDKNFLKPGDILSSQSLKHMRLVYDITRQNGEVTELKIAEASHTYNTGGNNAPYTRLLLIKTIAKGNIGSYIEVLRQNGYVVFSNNVMFLNHSYMPSDFVTLYGEQAANHTYNRDICTYAGDKAVFLLGTETVVLNYNTGNENGWLFENGTISVYREDGSDETLVSTYSIAEIDNNALPESQRQHALVLPDTDFQQAGKYFAEVSAGAEKSERTYFEVAGDDIVCIKTRPHVYEVTYRGIPSSWKIAGVMVRREVSANAYIAPIPELCVERSENDCVFELDTEAMAESLGATIAEHSIALFVNTEFGMTRTSFHPLN